MTHSDTVVTPSDGELSDIEHRARRPTILYATYVSPYPTTSGERIRTLNILRALSAMGYRVEAFVGNFESVALDRYSRPGELIFHQIPFEWPRLRQAFSVFFRPQRRFIEQVERLHRATPFEAVILDYGFLGAQITPLRHLGVPIIIGTHNFESALTGQIPVRSVTQIVPIRLRQALESLHERRFFPRADAVLCVSEEDRVAYARFIDLDHLYVVPNFVDIPDRYDREIRENRIIFSGSFSNFQNVEGLRWFVRNVWDETLWMRTSLCVAGKLSDQAVREFDDTPGIIGLGTRDDLLIELARSRLAIVPLWQGGGTRFKCIEAMATRTAVVTTSKGCEGIEHDDGFAIADDPGTFKSAILRLLDDPDAARSSAARARCAFDRCYSLSANARLLQDAISGARTNDRIPGHPPGDSVRAATSLTHNSSI